MKTKHTKDLTGQRFGRLTALRRLDEKSGTSYLWLCACDCGGETKATVSALNAGRVKSCGCERRGAESRDITGQRFGLLTAAEPTEARADGGSVVWKCVCDCGNTKDVPLNRLLRGKVRSCGCLSASAPKDWVGKRFGKLTVLSYAGKIGARSEENYWNCRCDCGNETTVGQTELRNGDTVSCGCRRSEAIRESLMLYDGTSAAILERNRQKLRATNKSGHTGVFQEKSGMWIAYINFKKKRYWLGRYQTKDEAVRARTESERIHEEFLDWYNTAFGVSGETGEEVQEKKYGTS